jgi:hypothetical protein
LKFLTRFLSFLLDCFLSSAAPAMVSVTDTHVYYLTYSAPPTRSLADRFGMELGGVKYLWKEIFITSTTEDAMQAIVEVSDKRKFLCSFSDYLSRRASAKLRRATGDFLTSACPSVYTLATTRLPLDGYLWNLIFEYFSKICLQKFNLIKIWQE